MPEGIDFARLKEKELYYFEQEQKGKWVLVRGVDRLFLGRLKKVEGDMCRLVEAWTVNDIISIAEWLYSFPDNLSVIREEGLGHYFFEILLKFSEMAPLSFIEVERIHKALLLYEGVLTEDEADEQD